MRANSMLVVAAAALAAAWLAAPGLPARAQQPAQAPDPRELIERTFGATRQVEVRDPLFNNMVAYTVAIPNDWVFEGAVLHGPGCMGSYYQSMALRAYSPDASMGVQIMPRLDYFYWEDKDSRPIGAACKYFAPMSSADYVAMFVDRNRTKAQIELNEPVTDAAQSREFFERGNEQMARSAARLRMPPEHDSIDFTRTRLRFEWQGYQEEEWLRAEMVYRQMPKSVFVYNGGPHPGHQEWRHFYYVSATLYSRRAPVGKLDALDPALNAILRSLSFTPDFQQASKARQQQLTNAIIHSIQNQTAINQQNSKAFMDAMTRQHDAFMANQQRQFDNSQQNAVDQMNRQTQQAHNFIGQMDASTARTRDYQDILLDQQYYVNPQTGETSTVSGRFNHAFVNGPSTSNATTVVQTDSNFNPNGPLGYNWTELMPIHH